MSEKYPHGCPIAGGLRFGSRGRVPVEDPQAGICFDKLEAVEAFLAMFAAVKRGGITVPNAAPYRADPDEGEPRGFRVRALPEELYRCLNVGCRTIWWVKGEESPLVAECPECRTRKRGVRSHGPWPLAWADPTQRPWADYVPVRYYRPRKKYTRRKVAA